MTLEEIAAKMQRGLDRHPMEDSLKFDFPDEGCITLADGQAQIADRPADCTIRMKKANFEKLLAGDLNPMTAFALGKIKVSGDMSVALKLADLLKSRG